MRDATLLQVDGCASWRLADRHLAALAVELDLTLTRETVSTVEAATRWGSVARRAPLVEGPDLVAQRATSRGTFPSHHPDTPRPAGAPTVDELHFETTQHP